MPGEPDFLNYNASDLNNDGTVCQGKAPAKQLQDALNTGRATNSEPTIYQQDGFNFVAFADDLYGAAGNVKSVYKNGTKALNSAKTIISKPISGVTKSVYSGYKTVKSGIGAVSKLSQYF